MGGELVKSKIKDPAEIWMYLLEKAFAKLYSSYEAICKGDLFDFLT